MTTQNESSRKLKAEKLYLELLERGIVSESEKVATKLLLESALGAEERTREVPSQKPAYKGKPFGFESVIDLVIYFITDLAQEWEKWKSQTVVWEQIEDEKIKRDLRPSLDRIEEQKGYERGNIRNKLNIINTLDAIEKMKKPTALVSAQNGNLSFEVFDSKTATAKAIGASIKKVDGMAKSGYKLADEATGADTGQVFFTMPVKVFKPTNSEEEYKAQREAHGFIYEPPEVRAERNKKLIARAEQQYKAECEAKGIEYIPPEIRRNKAKS